MSTVSGVATVGGVQYPVSAPVTLPAVGAVTHGRQVCASNTGVAQHGLTRADMTPFTGTLVAGGVYERMLFGGNRVTVSDVTFRQCYFENSGPSASCVIVQADRVLFEDCTIQPPDGVSTYMGIWYQSGTGLVVRGCDISRCENNISLNADGGSALIEDSWLHDSSKVSNPSAHCDTIEVYAGDGVTIRRSKLHHPTAETSAVNVVPWSGAAYVDRLTLEDCWVDGGHMHLVVGVQSTGYVRRMRVLRNDFGGHTTPTVIGSYTVLNNSARLPTVETEGELAANPNSILWPTSGPDANYWRDCAPLTPDRSGTIVVP